MLVSQLEHEFRQGKLTMQRMWFHVAPSVSTLEKCALFRPSFSDSCPVCRLQSLVLLILSTSCRGGRLLSLLDGQLAAHRGHPQFAQLLTFLLSQAAVPYFAMLSSWTTRGVFVDEYGEFMIQENQKVTKESLQATFNDAYWEMRYVLSEANGVPSMLEGVAERILTTGKYLNVVKECGVQIKSPVEKVRGMEIKEENMGILESV